MNLSPGRRTGGASLRSFCFVLLSLLAWSSIANAQPIETSPSGSPNWKARYYSLARKIVSLEKAWAKYKLDSETARTLLAELRISHASLQESLTDSQMSAQRSAGLSASLRTRFDTIWAQIQEVERAAQSAIRRAWITGAVVGIPVGIALAELVRYLLSLTLP